MSRDRNLGLSWAWRTLFRTRRRYDECGRNGRGSRTRHGTVFGHLEVLRGLAEENSSRKVNLFEDFTGRLDIGGVLGSAETAMYLYDVEPGDSFPYHYEYVEEWLLVLDGAVAVRTPQGEHGLQRGDLVRYPPGPEGAHQITNRSDTTARVARR